MMYSNEARGLAGFLAIWSLLSGLSVFVTWWAPIVMSVIEFCILITWSSKGLGHLYPEEILIAKLEADYYERHPQDSGQDDEND